MNVEEMKHDIDYRRFIGRWHGILTYKDLEIAEVTREDLDGVNTQKDLYNIASRAGKKRRSGWSYFPNDVQKKKMRRYLSVSLSRRPEIGPRLFNLLFGVGFQTYFGTWNSLRKDAGLEYRGLNKRVFEDKAEGREAIFNYVVGLTSSGQRPTQKEIGTTFHTNYETYGYDRLSDIRYPALEKVVYEILLADLETTLRGLHKRTGTSREIIKKSLDLKYMRAMAESSYVQRIYPKETPIWIDYLPPYP